MTYTVTYTVEQVCRAHGISRQAYYQGRRRPPLAFDYRTPAEVHREVPMNAAA